MAMVRRLFSAVAGGAVSLALVGAASAGVPEGRAALERFDYQAALTEFSNAAAGNDREAQYQLGLLYMLGHGGIPRDYARAAGWLRQAADAGHAAARYTLANLHATRTGLHLDYEQAPTPLLAAEPGRHEATKPSPRARAD